MMRTIIKAVAIAVVLLAIQPLASAAPAPQAIDLTEQFRGSGVAVDRLQVYEIAGIVIIRGRAANQAQAEAVGQYAQTLGYQRVANLIQLATHDDVQIARSAERELTVHRALDGCQFRVRSEKGIVHLDGRVRHELQKDVAASVLRRIDGVLSVEMTLSMF